MSDTELQRGFRTRFEWGSAGLARLGPGSDVIVIVDVFRFTTAVDAVLAAGGLVAPVEWSKRDPDRIQHLYLSPVHLATSTKRGDRVDLPSPNGAQLTVEATALGAHVMCGCLRNAGAVAAEARRRGERVTVIAAGERWDDGSLRPALEDLLGAGAILASLGPGDASPEAQLAAASFESVRPRLPGLLRACASGRWLEEVGLGDDIDVASQVGVSTVAPTLRDGVYVGPLPRPPPPGGGGKGG